MRILGFAGDTLSAIFGYAACSTSRRARGQYGSRCIRGLVWTGYECAEHLNLLHLTDWKLGRSRMSIGSSDVTARSGLHANTRFYNEQDVFSYHSLATCQGAAPNRSQDAPLQVQQERRASNHQGEAMINQAMAGPAAHTPEWYALHKTHVTASRIASIMGVSDYETPLDVYLEMKGKKPPFEGNEHTRRGTRYEPIIVADWCDQEGKTVAYPVPIFFHP